MQKIFNFLRNNKIIIFIILIALFTRFYKISTIPPSLNWDEVSHGYNAFSILKTGNDEWGIRLPIIFQAYGDYKLPVYIYLTALSEFFFGLTPFAVRLTSVLAGVGTIIFTYFLVTELFKKSQATDYKLLATLSALLVAVEPWSLFLGRGAFEANLSLFFIISGTYYFLRSLRNSSYLIHTPILFGLSVWTYNSARIFVPLLTVSLVLIYWRELRKFLLKSRKIFAFSILIFAFFFLPMFWQLTRPVGQARYGWVSILNKGAIAEIEEARNSSNLPPFVNKLANNRVTYFSNQFVKNWFSHFSANFLFLEGGKHYQFSIPGKGLIYLINLPLFLVGLIFLLKSKSKSGALVLSWLFLGPVASSLTSEAPHVLRAITMLPTPMIISAIGFSRVLEYFKPQKRYLVSTIYILVLAFLANNYIASYFGKYKSEYSWSWQYGYKEAVNYIKEHYDNYDKIIVTKKYGEPHEFILFFWPWDPNQYINDPSLNRFFQTDWFWVDSFDKFLFVNDWQIVDRDRDREKFILESGGEIDCSDVNCLLVTSPENVPDGWSKLETINFLDGKVAFEIYKN